jgi:hypothetical protein
MGGTAEDRASWKEPLHSLEIELERDFGLSPVTSRALVRRIGEVLESFVVDRPGARAPGQVVYTAVAVGERAGRPIRHCRTVPVTLTVLHSSDGELLHAAGSPKLRQTRLARVCCEAYRQGATLSHEDLAVLLALDLSTVRRLAASCAREGQLLPTRGRVQDIGPTVSHKEQVIRLYFSGVLPARIATRTGHSLGSVERYLADFARVAHLHLRGVAAESIARVTDLSPRLVAAYLDLVARHTSRADRPVLDRLLCRFGPLDDVGAQHG